jgi:hypothetical protein
LDQLLLTGELSPIGEKLDSKPTEVEPAFMTNHPLHQQHVRQLVDP